MADFKKIKELEHFKFVSDLAKAYPAAKIYLVGGVVRDAYLDIESVDYDLVVENVELRDLIKFLESHGKTKKIIGRSFGVIKFRPDSTVDQKIEIDIALPRREKYLEGMRRKHASVELQNVSIEEDLKRRDFTMNAMAVDLIIGEIIDPFQGKNDIKDKIIRAVGNPKDRFLEDPTRILRAIRFAVRFGFEIEEETFSAMIECNEEIVKKFAREDGGEAERVAWEMIGNEFLKTLSLDPVATLEWYDKTKLIPLLFPEIEALKGVAQPPNYHSEGDVFTHTMLALSHLSPHASLLVKLATLLHDVGKPTTFTPPENNEGRIRFFGHDKAGVEITKKFCARLRLPGKISTDLLWIIEMHMKIFFAFPKMRRDRQKAIVRHPLFDALLEVARADTMASVPADPKLVANVLGRIEQTAAEIRAEDLSQPQEIINGDEIIRVLKRQKSDFDPERDGKQIGKLKKEINSLYDRGEIKTKQEALALIK